MIAPLAWAALALLAGAGAARVVAPADRTVRALLALPLGLAMALGAGAWLAPLAGPKAPWLGAAAVALAGLGMVFAAPVRPGATRLHPFLGFLLVVVALAAWLYPVGRTMLDPGRDLLVQEAPYAVWVAAGHAPDTHPLGPDALPRLPFLAWLAASLGVDPLGAWQALGGLAQAFAFVAFFAGLAGVAGGTLPAFLGAGYLVFGTATSWILTPDAPGAVAHLLAACSVAAALSVTAERRAPALLALLLAAAVVPFSAPLAAGLAAAQLPWYAVLWAPPGARPGAGGLSFALGGLLVVLAPREVPPPPTAWLLLAPVAAAIAWQRGLPAVGLLLLLEVAGRSGGGASWAGSSAAAAVGVTLGSLLQDAWRQSPSARPFMAWDGGLRLGLPRRGLVGLAVLLLVRYGFDAGETAWNRSLLLAAQKQGVDVLALAAPRTLESWVLARGAARDVGPADVAAARALRDGQGPFLALTPAALREPVEAAGVLAALSGRPAAGWYADPAEPGLDSGALAYRATGNARLLLGMPVAQVLLRGDNADRASEVLRARSQGPGFQLYDVTPEPAGGPPLPDELRLLPVPPRLWVPGRTERLALDVQPALPSTNRVGFRLRRQGDAEPLPVQLRAGEPLPTLLPAVPGLYRFEFYARSGEDRRDLGDGGLGEVASAGRAAMASLRARLEGITVPWLAGRIQPGRLVLENPGGYPVDLEGLRLRIDVIDAVTGRPDPHSSLEQPLVPEEGGGWILPPGGRATFAIQLVSPDLMELGASPFYRPEVRLLARDGSTVASPPTVPAGPIPVLTSIPPIRLDGLLEKAAERHS